LGRQTGGLLEHPRSKSDGPLRRRPFVEWRA
jgi:hypothetical protein